MYNARIYRVILQVYRRTHVYKPAALEGLEPPPDEPGICTFMPTSFRICERFPTFCTQKKNRFGSVSVYALVVRLVAFLSVQISKKKRNSREFFGIANVVHALEII